MIAKFGGQCRSCYREIPAGAEVQYARGRGIRHLDACPPLSTEELLAGRDRFFRYLNRKIAAHQSFEKHDAANEAWNRPATEGAEHE